MILKNALALITGGAQGLGKSFALSLLRSGANVVIADIDQKAGVDFETETAKRYGKDRLKFIKCDVSDTKELHETFMYSREHFGRLDIVCNNAAIMSCDVTRASKQVAINMTALIEATYKGIDIMSLKNGGKGGVVINIASNSGYNILKGHAVYTATKFGVIGFSRSFKFLDNVSVDGVRVNCLCPHFLDTEMTRRAIIENPEITFQLDRIGYANMDDVVKAFMICIGDKNMNGEAIAVHAAQSIYQLKFRQPVPLPVKKVK